MKTNSDELSIFVNVVESGSFSRAAEHLNMANSVVSRSVKRLEQKLGVNLLNRTTRNLSLTAEGERYFVKVRNILQEMANAEAEMLATHQTPQGILRIDAATPVIFHLITPMIEQFRKRYPLIELSLVSSETYINLIERKVDVAVRIGELKDSSLRSKLLFNSYRKMIAAPAYLEKYGVPNRIDELSQHQCLGFIEPEHLNIWPLAENHQLYQIMPTMTASSGETLRQLCLSGNGIACLSDFQVDKDIQAGNLIELFVDKRIAVPMPVNAVYYSDRAVSTRIRAFIDFLVENMQQPE